MIVASPAAAGESASYAPVPDTLTLLMLDSSATFTSGAVRAVPDMAALLMLDSNATFARPIFRSVLDLPELRGFDVRVDITPDDVMRPGIAAFEGMRVAPAVDTPLMAVGFKPARPAFRDPDMPIGSSLARFEDALLGEGARYAVREAMTRRLRPPRVLDGRVVLRIDGKEESPVLTIGGGLPAAVYNMIPKE